MQVALYRGGEGGERGECIKAEKTGDIITVLCNKFWLFTIYIKCKRKLATYNLNLTYLATYNLNSAEWMRFT